MTIGLLSCYRNRQIEVQVTDFDTGYPVTGIQVIITNVEHHSSGNFETVIYTDEAGIAKKATRPQKKMNLKYNYMAKMVII